MPPLSPHGAPGGARQRFYGWQVVAAAFVMAVLGWGVGFYGPAVYLQAVHETRGWSLGLISTAITTHFLAGVLAVANLPAIYRRFGVPVVTMAGASALALGVAGWALAPSPAWLFAAALVSGIGWALMGTAAVNAIVAVWFVRLRPAALAMAYNGASVGGVVFLPLWVAAIAWLGFLHATLAVGVVMMAVMAWITRVVFARTPQSLGVKPDGDAPGAPAASVTSPHAVALPGARLWRDARFATLTIGTALGLFAQIGLIAHLFSLMVPALGAQQAGLVMGLATACAVAGRTLLGWLMPVGADRRLVACANYAVQIAGSLLLLAADGGNVTLLIIGAVLFGAGIGNTMTLPPLIAQVEFVREDVPRVAALIVAFGQATYAFAPAVLGLVREATEASPGVAPWVFASAAAVQATAAAVFLAGRRR